MLTFSEYVSRHEDPEAEYEYLEKMILKFEKEKYEMQERMSKLKRVLKLKNFGH